MPLGRSSLKQSYLDPELCYAAWLVQGSIRKAANWLMANGVRGYGDNISAMALQHAAKKSDSYKLFMSRRESGEIQQEVATKEELERAREILKERIPIQLQIVEEIHAPRTPRVRVNKGKIIDRGGDW